MPRPRNKENQGLPKRWRHAHGAYYYQVPPGLEHLWGGKKTFRLGKTLREAYQVWVKRMDAPIEARTVAQLLDRYLLEVVPSKAAASQQPNQLAIQRLRAVFGHMPLLPFQPKLVYQYVDARSRKTTDPKTGRLVGGKTVAHREVEILSHAYTKAVEWGYIDRHPFLGQVRLEGEEPEERYVEDWEVIECLALASRRKRGSVGMIQAYIRVKLLTGMGQGDLLRLKPAVHFTKEGILIQRHKTKGSSKKRTLYRWSPQLRDAVDRALAARTAEKSDFLFATRDGKGYLDESSGRASGWKSMWQRFMERVVTETKVTEPFTERDLRAKVATDAKSLEHARALLSHADARTTRRIYRRKPEVVAPLKRGAKLYYSGLTAPDESRA